MFINKLRTTIALIAAAFAVAVTTGPVAPAAHALDDTPQISQEGCQAMWDQFATYVRLAVEADKRGDIADRDYYLGQAREYKNKAKAGGCSWAQFRRAKLHRLAQRVATVGSPTVRPEASTSTGTTTVSPRPGVDDASTAGTVSPSAAG
jgi:hypothetical protein